MDCQLSIECARAYHIAFILSTLRRSSVLDVEDLLGGVFIALGETMSIYWKTPDGFKWLVQGEAGLTGALKQIQMEGIETFSAFGLPGSGASIRALSPPLIRTLRRAQGWAIERRPSGKPTVKPEDYLLALAMEPSAGLGTKFLQSGLEIDLLEQAVKGG